MLNTNSKPIAHNALLTALLDDLQKIDFRQKANIDKLKPKHYRVTSVEEIIQTANSKNWGICVNNGSTYLYNGGYWSLCEDAEIQKFLGSAAEKLGIDKYDAKDYEFQDKVYKQFNRDVRLSRPASPDNTTLINLLNGTFEISQSRQYLREPSRRDFITYQLPFNYDPSATCPLFMKYMNVVQPDVTRQNILAEYLGYLFIKTSTLKLEKALLLYGSGANGKSVFFEITNALLGGLSNVSNYSLQSLTNESGYYRAKLPDKLVNYASEINGKLESSIFKLLVSGEPVEARQIYGDPFTITNYAKLIFNCNELPSQVEHTNAFFRRFLIVPFDVTIAEADQDRELPGKIIESELSGVFNWVLDGLQRLLVQKRFTYSEAVEKQIGDYKKQSDSVQLFLEDEGYITDTEHTERLQYLYEEYSRYCRSNGYTNVSSKKYADRLRHAGYIVERRNVGRVVYIKKNIVSF